MLCQFLMQSLPGFLKLFQIFQNDMSRQSIFRCADRPDVEVVNRFYVGILQQVLPDVIHLNPLGDSIHRQPHTLLEQPPGGEEDDRTLAELMADIKEKSQTISAAVAELEKLLANINED